MDFDLEIISEEGESPDPLFSSIISAMNSMKEATADKIYQKIQKEGETNYSKPQVDRALANALKYGIFEIKNNRYRVRDDFLDDEDTVYWQLHRKREQTPFRIREDINDRQFGPKLDPEKDNLRFKKMMNMDKAECPQCGRIKRPWNEDDNDGDEEEGEKKKKSNRGRKPKRRRKSKKRYVKAKLEEKYKNTKMTKRKTRQDTMNEEKNKISNKDSQNNKTNRTNGNVCQGGTDEGNNSTVDSEYERPSSPSEDEQSFANYSKNIVKHRNRKSYKYPTDKDLQVDGAMGAKASGTSFKSEFDSDETDVSYESDDANQTGYQETFFESLPCTSKNAELASHSSGTSYQNQLSSDLQGDGNKEKSNWMECTDEPQGTIIESRNVLTIEPMDMLVLKSSEQASYIS